MGGLNVECLSYPHYALQVSGFKIISPVLKMHMLMKKYKQYIVCLFIAECPSKRAAWPSWALSAAEFIGSSRMPISITGRTWTKLSLKIRFSSFGVPRDPLV